MEALGGGAVSYERGAPVGDWDPQEAQAKWWGNFVADFSVSLSLYFTFEVRPYHSRLQDTPF